MHFSQLTSIIQYITQSHHEGLTTFKQKLHAKGSVKSLESNSQASKGQSEKKQEEIYILVCKNEIFNGLAKIEKKILLFFFTF